MKLVLEFEQPEAPWSTNQDRQYHHQKRHKFVKAWKEAASKAWEEQMGGVPLDGFYVVQVTIPFGNRRRRDPHNYCGTVMKAIIDGLVEAGAWPDDNPEYVGHREPILVIGTGVTVTIESGQTP